MNQKATLARHVESRVACLLDCDNERQEQDQKLLTNETNTWNEHRDMIMNYEHTKTNMSMRREKQIENLSRHHHFLEHVAALVSSFFMGLGYRHLLS